MPGRGSRAFEVLPVFIEAETGSAAAFMTSAAKELSGRSDNFQLPLRASAVRRAGLRSGDGFSYSIDKDLIE